MPAVMFVPIVLLLLAPQSVRNALFARFLPILMKRMAQKTHNQRTLLLQHVHGKVLDVGSGGGGYMPYLAHKAAHIVALEPLDAMHPTIVQAAIDAGMPHPSLQLTTRSDTLESYACHCPYEHGTFDWIILGNVLCHVTNLEEALQAAHVLLKPGGHVYFCEHVASPSGTWQRCLQELAQPSWGRISAGCHANRDTLHAIQGIASWDTVTWPMEHVSLVLGNRLVMGLARKVECNI
jgi:SAM-dependent methyltransferase